MHHLAALLLLTPMLFAEESKPPDLAKLPPAANRTIDYQRDIAPILTRACIGCHGPEKQRTGLRLDSKTEALKGGNSGAVLEPGHAVKSRLLLIVAGLDAETNMPPKGKPPLTAEEIGRLRAWIDQGLKWPTDSATVTHGPASSHWAFQPPRRVTPPAITDSQVLIRNPIDVFVGAKRQAAGLDASPEADRSTLIRRVTLDLTGLPPALREVDDFLNDRGADAYEKVVERLLASPHYGERWGRLWLDNGRYADSDGYEKDSGRPNAWRWRDWVIEALNRDLPYSQFIIEQLAGDLLPNATPEQKIATGFHRNTLTNREGGVDQEQFRVEAVVDRVNTTAKVFLGVTLGCAQCHDHKYDPFSQREYYQFFAFFNSDAEVNVPVPAAAGSGDYARLKTQHDERRLALVAAVAEEQKRLDPKLSAAEVKKKLAAAQQKLAAHDKAAPQPPMAQGLALGKPRKTQVMVRGDFLRKGVEVQPGTPAVFPAMHGTNRLDLANWIVRGDNPLTVRVLANWMWQKYFGRGLVPTLEDFGTQGEKSSHPELLDWLAAELVRQGWSMKAMHRLIVTSATYRQSSKVRPELAQRDPLNVLLARQSRLRLEAELVRDAALASSGLLTRAIGGPSVRPPQPSGVSELSYAGSVKWIESQGADRYRRGLYIWFQRTSPYPMLMTFDSPDGNLSCVRREKSNTPLQALTLLNDTAFVECAQALGKRIVEEKPKADAAERVRHGFRLAAGRTPTESELKRLVRLQGELFELCNAHPKDAAKLIGAYKSSNVPVAEAAAWAALARTLLNLDEVVTRE